MRPSVNPHALNQEFLDWLRSLVEAYESNCVALEVLNGQSPKQAQKDCTLP